MPITDEIRTIEACGLKLFFFANDFMSKSGEITFTLNASSMSLSFVKFNGKKVWIPAQCTKPSNFKSLSKTFSINWSNSFVFDKSNE